jgi:hypothetical protein
MFSILSVDLRYRFDCETNMICSHNMGRGGAVSPLIVCDLRAQLAPLNRYGLPRFGAAVADGLVALISVSRSALAHSSLVARCLEFT